MLKGFIFITLGPGSGHTKHAIDFYHSDIYSFQNVIQTH